MTGTLYTVSKKPNSTARPGGTGTPVSFVLKGACSVQAPVFTMKERPAGNYLYVPSFSRYYWITDILRARRVGGLLRLRRPRYL